MDRFKKFYEQNPELVRAAVAVGWVAGVLTGVWVSKVTVVNLSAFPESNIIRAKIIQRSGKTRSFDFIGTYAKGDPNV